MGKSGSIFVPRRGDLLVDPEGRSLVIGDVSEGADLDALIPRDTERAARYLPPEWDYRGNLITLLRAALLREGKGKIPPTRSPLRPSVRTDLNSTGG